MKFFVSDNTELEFNWLALESEMGEALQDDPLNPNQATTVIATGFATAGLTGLLQATGMDAATAAGTAAAIGALLPNASLTNWALTDAGIIASYQGALITIPGLSEVVGVQVGGNRYPGTTELDYNFSITQRYQLMAELLMKDCLISIKDKDTEVYLMMINLAFLKLNILI